jgi:hypothetical protein
MNDGPPIGTNCRYSFDRRSPWREQDGTGVEESEDGRGIIAEPGLNERGIECADPGSIALGQEARWDGTRRSAPGKAE